MAMALHHQISQELWTQDFQFVVSLRVYLSIQDGQVARLQDYLEMRYYPELVPQVFLTLKYSYNWMVHHWDCLLESGFIVDDNGRKGVMDCLIIALYDFSSTIPIELITEFPDLDPLIVLKRAQGYLDKQ